MCRAPLFGFELGNDAVVVAAVGPVISTAGFGGFLAVLATGSDLIPGKRDLNTSTHMKQRRTAKSGEEIICIYRPVNEGFSGRGSYFSFVYKFYLTFSQGGGAHC